MLSNKVFVWEDWSQGRQLAFTTTGAVDGQATFFSYRRADHTLADQSKYKKSKYIFTYKVCILENLQSLQYFIKKCKSIGYLLLQLLQKFTAASVISKQSLGRGIILDYYCIYGQVSSLSHIYINLHQQCIIYPFYIKLTIKGNILTDSVALLP